MGELMTIFRKELQAIGIPLHSTFTVVTVYLLCIALITSMLLALFYLMQRYTPKLLRVTAGRK